MSGENYPTLSYVMPIFVELFFYIKRHVANVEDENPMKDALTAAHAVLSKYYSFTDDSSYYLLFNMLDPRFKKTYLEQKEFDSFFLNKVWRVDAVQKK
jgi:hypothetical protein